MREKIEELFRKAEYITNITARVQNCLDIKSEIEKEHKVPEQFYMVKGINNVGFFDTESFVGFYSDKGRIVIADNNGITTIELEPINENEIKRFLDNYPEFEFRFYSWVKEVL